MIPVILFLPPCIFALSKHRIAKSEPSNLPQESLKGDSCIFALYCDGLLTELFITTCLRQEWKPPNSWHAGAAIHG